MWNFKICDVTLGGGSQKCDHMWQGGSKIIKLVWRNVWMAPNYGVHVVEVTVSGIQHVLWVLGVRPRSGTRHFPYNENSTRVLNTTLLKCCLSLTDAINRRGKIHACVWRFKVSLWKRASLNPPGFRKKSLILSWNSNIHTMRMSDIYMKTDVWDNGLIYFIPLIN